MKLYRPPVLSPLHPNLFKGCIGRTVSVTLILILAVGSGSPVFARSVAGGLSAPKNLAELSRFVPKLGLTKSTSPEQAFTESRGMPPHPPPSASIRPEPPESRSALEARVARLVLNLRGGVTLTPGESVQLAAVPEDNDGTPVHGVAAEWSSLNLRTVTVTESGEAKALAVGVAPVTATIGQISVTLVVTVASMASASASGNKKPRTITARKLAGRVPDDSQHTSHNPSFFAHASSGAAVVRPPQFGIIESEQLYEPENAVGAPPGKTTPGANSPGAAIETIETPGSANFMFSLGAVSLPGRGFDLNFGVTHNSRLWTKSLENPTEMTYNTDGGWIAPGFVAGYGYLDNQSEGSIKQS